MYPVQTISVSAGADLKHLPNPDSASAAFEFSLAPHGLTPGWELFRVHESPRAGVALGVKGPAIFRIIVLDEAGRQPGRLSDVYLTHGIQQDIHGVLRGGL